MDELLSALSSNSISNHPNDTAAEHPRFALYKPTISICSQSVRRKRLLDQQKERRFDAVNYARKLAISEFGPGDAEENGEECEVDMDCDKRRFPRAFKNQLMLSEWLVDVPEDFALNWFLVPCPIGKRCLVIASNGITKSYSRSGYRFSCFPSHLPGGSKHTNAKGSMRHSYTLLDCIYNELCKTYFIIDVMCWNSHQVYESDTEFRFYWIKTKLEETPSVSEVSSSNPFKFSSIPYYPCDEDTIKQVVSSSLPFPCQLDGLMFYHKALHYLPGEQTPLIGWLKIYQVPEILKIPVAHELCTDNPDTVNHSMNLFAKAHEKRDRMKEMENFSMHIDAH